MDEQKLNITFEKEQNKKRETKEVPTWMTESTVAVAG